VTWVRINPIGYNGQPVLFDVVEKFTDFDPEWITRIQSCVMPLTTVHPDTGEYIPLGTGFMLTDGLLVTAGHVVREAMKHSSRQLKDGKWQDAWAFYALYNSDQKISEDRYLGGMVPISQTCTSDLTDIAFCRLDLPVHIETGEKPRVGVTDITFRPPRVGEHIMALGYHERSFGVENPVEGEAMVDAHNVIVRASTAQSHGVVTDVRPLATGLRGWKFPCFETDARFAGGMSGGPIFGEKNGVVGIVSTGLGDSNGLGSLLWPGAGMQLPFYQPREDGLPTTLLDLVRLGTVHCDESKDLVEVRYEESGRTHTSIRLPKSPV
jgi:hypothetical protein